MIHYEIYFKSIPEIENLGRTFLKYHRLIQGERQ